MSAEHPPRPSLHYRLLLTLFRLLFRLLARVDVQGRENIPLTGPLLVASNHINSIEGPLVFCMLPRHPVSALAKLEWKDTLVARLVLNAINPVFVARGEVDRTALKEIRQRLEAGEAFGVAPEGTRSGTGKLAEGKEGVAYIAMQADATVVPAASWGQEQFFSDLKRLRRPTLHLHFGKPMRLARDPSLSRRDNLTANTERMMLEIARMLPPYYRGFYADHIAQLEAAHE